MAQTIYTDNHEYYSNPAYYGSYQFLRISEIVDNFIATYVGEGKILQNTLRGDVNFHAHRALQELTYDTLKSFKNMEIMLPPSLKMPLPSDYINYTKLTWSDGSGVEHIIYPTSKTSKGQTVQQDEEGNYQFTNTSTDTLNNPGLAINRPTHTTAGQLAAGLSTFSLDITGPYLLTANSTGPFALQHSIDTGYHANASGNVVPKPADESILKVGMEIISDIFPTGTTVTQIDIDITDPDITKTIFHTSNATINWSTGNLPATGTYASFVDVSGDTTWGKYKDSSGNSVAVDNSLTTNASVDADNYFSNTGGRRGLDPQYAQANGSFFIDTMTGMIYFSSNLSGKTILLHYISDSIKNESERIIHKFAEEAMYKWIAYGCLSALANVPEYLVQRYKKEKFAETRKAKIRLSSIKIEEITQIMRGKSKWIKH